MISFHTAATGNGYRIAVLLEEMQLSYRTRLVDFGADETRSPGFLAINPLGKVPVIEDDEGPDGAPIVVAESLAIALYLVEKTGRFEPATATERVRALTWGSALVSGFGASFAGVFFARQLGAEPHAPFIEKSLADLRFQLSALDSHLADHRFIAGDAFSWIDGFAAPLIGTARVYNLDLAPLIALHRWSDEVLSRPAVKRGLLPPIPSAAA